MQNKHDDEAEVGVDGVGVEGKPACVQRFSYTLTKRYMDWPSQQCKQAIPIGQVVQTLPNNIHYLFRKLAEASNSCYLATWFLDILFLLHVNGVPSNMRGFKNRVRPSKCPDV